MATPSPAKTAEVFNTHRRRARPAAAAKYLSICRSTLYEWVRTRPGFPKPHPIGPRVVLFDLDEIDAFIDGATA